MASGLAEARWEQGAISEADPVAQTGTGTGTGTVRLDKTWTGAGRVRRTEEAGTAPISGIGDRVDGKKRKRRGSRSGRRWKMSFTSIHEEMLRWICLGTA